MLALLLRSHCGVCDAALSGVLGGEDKLLSLRCGTASHDGVLGTVGGVQRCSVLPRESQVMETSRVMETSFTGCPLLMVFLGGN